jgi:hypothetical protein
MLANHPQNTPSTQIRRCATTTSTALVAIAVPLLVDSELFLLPLLILDYDVLDVEHCKTEHLDFWHVFL